MNPNERNEDPGPAIGIDLGTTYTCVGVWQHGRVEIIVNGQGNRTTPSYVAFTDEDLLVGDAAVNQVARNPTNTIFDAKRLIGRRYGDSIVQEDLELWPFKVDEGIDEKPIIDVQYKGDRVRLTPEEISSIILKDMRKIAESYLGTTVRNAVITVPAHFNNSQRQATKDAGEAAGLRVMQVISEPTAAAIAYGLDKKRTGYRGKKNVLIFDLGGGTFDVSLLSVHNGSLRVKATAGDSHLGGVDIDNRLVEHCVREFKRKHGADLDVTANPRAIRRLRTACEKAKRALSYMVETAIEVEYLYQGLDFRTTISRAKFEELNMDLFRKCMDHVDCCLQDADMDKTQIDEVVLVGGSTRVPKVQDLIIDMFGSDKVCKSINPDEAVAHGAAIRAAMLCGVDTQKVDDLVLHDVTPLSLGLRTLGGVMNVLIPRNTPIPVVKEKDFTTTNDGQTNLKFLVYEGERLKVKENNLLAKFELSGIRKATKMEPRITVRFEIDDDGILTVSAEDRCSKKRSDITVRVEGDGRLTAAEVARRVYEAEKNRERDLEEVRKVAAKMRMEGLVGELRKVLGGHYGVEVLEKKGLVDAIDGMETWLKVKYDEVDSMEIDRKRMELETMWGVVVGRIKSRASPIPATPGRYRVEKSNSRMRRLLFWK